MHGVYNHNQDFALSPVFSVLKCTRHLRLMGRKWALGDDS